MKTILTVFLSVFTLSYSIAQEHIGIKFKDYPSWKEVLTIAKKANKKIFVDVYTTWCGPCKQMDNEVYPDAQLGAFMDSTYINIKVQADSTGKDNDQIARWRLDARSLVMSAKIPGYPSYLFYDSDGVLIYKAVGFRNVNEFTQLAKFSADPARASFQSDLLAFQNGKRDYSKMPALATIVRDVLGDGKLATEIAKIYKRNYLDKLSSDEFLTVQNIRFVHDNGGPILVDINDHFFKAAYEQPSLIDSLTMPGMSQHYVNGVISIYVAGKLYNEGQPISSEPNWKDIEREISKKYAKVGASKFILNEKIMFYLRNRDYSKFSEYKTEQLAKYPPKPQGLQVLLAYNFPAWDMFLKSKDPKVLKNALNWVEKGIELEPSRASLLQYLDTKANLLYKLGRKRKAIAFEQYAIDVSKAEAKTQNRERPLMIDEFEHTLSKMKRNIPTWQ